jgi:hypothetical protein
MSPLNSFRKICVFFFFLALLKNAEKIRKSQPYNVFLKIKYVVFFHSSVCVYVVFPMFCDVVFRCQPASPRQ